MPWRFDLQNAIAFLLNNVSERHYLNLILLSSMHYKPYDIAYRAFEIYVVFCS